MKYFFMLFGMIFLSTGQAQEIPLDSLLRKAFSSKDSSAVFFKQSKQRLFSKADTANFYYYKFYKNYVDGEIDSAYRYGELVIPPFIELDTLNRLRKIYEKMNLIDLRSGNYDRALAYCQKALKIAEKLKDTAMISIHLSDMSIIYHDYEEYSNGVMYGKKAFEVMNNATNKDYKYILYANNAIGINFDDWGKPDSALAYHFQNLDYLKHIKDTLPYTFIFNNIGNTLLKQKKYVEAKKYIKQALVLNTRGNRTYNLATNYTNLATIAYKLNHYSEADSLFKEAQIYVTESGSIEKLRDLMEHESKYNEKIGNYKKALEKQAAFYKLKDSVFKDERASKIAEAEAKFQVAQKEVDLAITRANLAETQLKVKKRNNFIYGSLGLASMLGILGFLFYNQQKLKNRQLQKEAQLKEALVHIETQNKLQEQRLRISRDLHDNIGSQLTFVTSSVDNLKFRLKDDDPKVTQRLGEISEFTIQTIYELRDTIWAMNKTEINFEDLQTRIANFIENAGIAAKGVDFQFSVSENIAKETVFSSIKGMNIYRIIQEGINNALKHAGAQEVSVRINKALDSENEEISIHIDDNGKGFDRSNVKMGNGLASMKKRAKDMGSEIEITSEENKGTFITLITK